MKLKPMIMILFFLTAAVFPQKIIVTSPAAGEVINSESSYTIKWTATGIMDPNVKINIFRNSISQTNFVEQITSPNNGSAIWKITKNYNAGQYLIRIKTADNKVIGDSSPFSIKSSQQNISMDIILPKSGQVFNVGDPLSVEWISSGLLGDTLQVFLCKGVNGVQYVSTIANEWPNTPHLQRSWKIPLNLAAGNYKIVVLDITGINYHGNVFTVKPPVTVQIIQANVNHLNRLSINNRAGITKGTKPYILSFYPDKLARRIPSIPGAEDLFLVILNFYWKDDDGDLLNGKWHFSYKSDKFGYSGNQSGRIGEKNSARYTGIKGSVIGFEAISIKGKVNDQVRIWFVLEDSQGNFSDKMTGLVTLSQ